MKTYDLNKLNIVKNIDHITTPACVICEIYEYVFGSSALFLPKEEHLIESNTHTKNMVDEIKLRKKYILRENEWTKPKVHGFSESDLQEIVRYVNPNQHWGIKSLITAFRHIMEFIEEDPPSIPKEFTIGKKTVEDPYALTACMLYRICSYYKIKTERKTTLFQMSQSVKYLICDPIELKAKIDDIITNFNKVELINLMISNEMSVTQSPSIRANFSNRRTVPIITEKKPKIVGNIEPEFISRDDINKTIERFNDSKNILPRIDAENHNEAIVLASIIYGINLCECNNPYNEYMSMKEASFNSLSENKWIPIENVFRMRYLQNPNWYNLKLTWEPKLSNIYKAQHIINFALSEGYKDIDNKQQAEELLWQSRCTATFYLGVHPYVENKKTPLELDNSNEVNRNILLSYGIVDDKKFTLFKVTELISVFTRQLAFSNPENMNEQFSPISIAKLRNIAIDQLGENKKKNKVHIYPFMSALTSSSSSSSSKKITAEDEVKSAYSALLKIMDEIEELNKSLSPSARKLVEIYKNVNYREDVDILLNLVMEMGYYMRGWKIETEKRKKDQLPIKETETNPDQFDELTVNVTSSISSLMNKLEKVDEKCKMVFTSLPLMILRKSAQRTDIIFEVNQNTDEGLTIMDRVFIVKKAKGDDDENVYACIRLSSNRFLSSAYYYRKLLGLSLDFDIKDMSDIS
jgi:hypothetical protein